MDKLYYVTIIALPLSAAWYLVSKNWGQAFVFIILAVLLVLLRKLIVKEEG